ncbi:MAG: flagellar hook-length control protein FliK [Lentisphaerales bacterium]|nr:flagellar hook-length control protein FliK [Lentisphaerales bacterium]
MNPFAMNTVHFHGRDVYWNQMPKTELNAPKWNEPAQTVSEEKPEAEDYKCFEEHLNHGEVQTSKKETQRSVYSAEELPEHKELSDENAEIDGLDREQVKKIEKTVRKLLLESIHLSPEKFNELTVVSAEGGKLPESFGEILDKLEQILAKLKNLAGESTQTLSEKDVALAGKVINKLKGIISGNPATHKELEKALTAVVDSPEAKALLKETFALEDKVSAQDFINQAVSQLQKVAGGASGIDEKVVAKTTPVPKSENIRNVSPQSDVKEGLKNTPDKSSLDKLVEPENLGKEGKTSKETTLAQEPSSSKDSVGPAKQNNFKVVNKGASPQSPANLKETELSKVPDDISKMVKKVTVEVKDEAALTKDLFRKDELKNSLNKPTSNQQRAVGPDSQKALAQQNQQEQSKENTGEDPAKKGLDPDKKSLNFLKKLKNIVKKNESSENPFSEQIQNKSVQKNKLNFINKMNASSLVKQLVDKIDKFIKSSQSTSTTIDLQSPGLGDMKVAAEVTGAKLSLNISSLSQSIRAELIHLRSELNQDLKSLGFEDVELGFDFGDEENSKGNPFEEQMEEKRQKDPVKLPGDYLADLAEISTWLKSFNAS